MDGQSRMYYWPRLELASFPGLLYTPLVFDHFQYAKTESDQKLEA